MRGARTVWRRVLGNLLIVIRARRRVLSLRIKQEAMAHELGGDLSQKKISLLEQKETVDEAILAQVSEILRIPVEAPKDAFLMFFFHQQLRLYFPP